MFAYENRLQVHTFVFKRKRKNATLQIQSIAIATILFLMFLNQGDNEWQILAAPSKYYTLHWLLTIVKNTSCDMITWC